ncbi:MAG TPA: secretin and TonB N-terminal domain-containing protein, partial [Rhizomicrobium sp.]|nr:secretin and TonB N-terminal domain-containing protein [Rhizomicrobium sp.]
MREGHMLKTGIVKTIIVLAVFVAAAMAIAPGAQAINFNIPKGDLRTALDSYAAQTGMHVLYAEQAIAGIQTSGLQGSASADDALLKLLKGTGFTARRDDGSVAIVRSERQSERDDAASRVALASAPAASGAALETVTVTSSKIGGDVQNIPISITALSQEQLTQTQTAGGPDLVKQVPNLTFSKTNFTGYNIEIRGIGTQA